MNNGSGVDKPKTVTEFGRLKTNAIPIFDPKSLFEFRTPSRVIPITVNS